MRIRDLPTYLFVGSLIFITGIVVGFYELPPVQQIKILRWTLFPNSRILSRGEGGAYYRSRRDMFENLPTGPDVFMLGDSLTEQGPWSELFPTVFVANRGIGGDTLEAVRKRVSG